ncbi:MAG: hypothetical protein IKZ87_00555, partial [Actinomycetaceae bacterium]|nr:hypothetical protein [Actinomycetaceae bacterium]
EYYDVVWGYYGQAQEHVSAFLYATEKDGDGVFSMGDVTTDAERENLFGSLYVGKGNITANKKLVGRPLEGGEFSFGVYRASDIENAGGTTAGLTPLVTATNSAPSSSDGTGAIDLPVSRAKTGRWVHVIGLAFSGDEMAPGSLVQFTGKQDGSDVWAGEEFSGLAVGEIDAGNARINYDTNIVPVADFDVTPYGQTPISTVHLEQTGGGATFSNSVRSAEMTVAHVKKVLHGRTLANEEFTFQLCEDAQCNTVLETKKNDSSGTVPFEGLTFDVAGLADGTYTWYVREVMPASPENGMTYDTHVQPVAITVQGGGLVDVSCGADTTCSADPNAPEIKTYTFTNEYFNPYTTGLASQSIALYAMLAIAVFAGGVAVVYARFAKGKIFAARDV